MPESPEVQVFAEFVAERAIGRSIAALEVVDFRAYKTRSVAPGVLAGCRVAAVTRHGKYVDIDATDHHLVLSFGRHGWGEWYDPLPPESPEGAQPAVARVRLDDGAGVVLTDSGGFRSAGLWIVDRPSEVPAIAKLGPDPVATGFTRSDFDAPLVGRRKQVKAVLQEQESFAGIGNAYSDEILYVARLSPVTHAAVLTEAERDRLFEATRRVLGDAIAARRGIPIDGLKAAKVAAMLVHGRAGEPCPGCAGTIRDVAFGGTTAQYCPECQTDGVILT